MDGNEKESGTVQERINSRLAARPVVAEKESPAKACPFLMIAAFIFRVSNGESPRGCLREGCQLWDPGEEHLYTPGCGLVRRTDRQVQYRAAE